MATAPWQQMETESLEVQPWSVMSAGGKVCLVKGVFDEEGYEVAVWDMCLAWTEKLEKDEITGRMTVQQENEKECVFTSLFETDLYLSLSLSLSLSLCLSLSHTHTLASSLSLCPPSPVLRG